MVQHAQAQHACVRAFVCLSFSLMEACHRRLTASDGEKSSAPSLVSTVFLPLNSFLSVSIKCKACLNLGNLTS